MLNVENAPTKCRWAATQNSAHLGDCGGHERDAVERVRPDGVRGP